jgi:hypothetical protein
LAVGPTAPTKYKEKVMKAVKFYRRLFVFTLLLAMMLGIGFFTGNADRKRVALADSLNRHRLTASYVIFTDGEQVYALNSETGRIEFEGPDAAAVIRSTIAPRRKVFITAGKYVITSPLELVSYFELEMEMGAILEVPNGYDGIVFRLESGTREEAFGVNHARIKGGTVREERTPPYDPNPPSPVLYPQRRWTAFLFHITDVGGGLYWNMVEDVEIWDPDVAFQLQIDATDGWFNDNEFKGVNIHSPNNFIVFGTSLPEPAPVTFNSNHFMNIQGQAGYNSTYGVKDIRGRGNTFLDCKFWDLKNPDAVSASLTPYAIDTLILGGLMTQKMDNRGHRTQIIDRFSGNGLTLDELVVGRASVSTAYYMHADDDGLHVREHDANRDALSLDPDGTLSTDAGITLNGDLRLNEAYRIFGEEGALFLEDETTSQVYRFVLQPVLNTE